MNPPELGCEAGRGTGALRAPLVLLGLWALLASVQGSQGRPSWRYVSSEVVTPRKETRRGKGFQAPGWLSYSLRFGGQRHIIHLRRKILFWPRHLLVMTQDDQGALQMDHPYVPADCYYLGYLEEIPLSTVAVDMCYGGLHGVMKLDDLAYEIKPLKDSRSFEHVVSQIVADRNATGPMYTLRHREDVGALLSEADPSAAPRLSPSGYASHASHVIGQVQCSTSMFRMFANISMCIQFVVRLSSLSDNMLRGLNSRFLLTLITIYTDRDPAPLNDYRVPGKFHNKSMTQFRCGNSVVEDTEQCDCGSLKQCYTSECCKSNCRFTPRSNCHIGSCCTNCTYSPSGTLCRPVRNICDLPEYCTGSSISCPRNVYMQDGTPCTQEGYCYKGNCTDRSMHCKEIFGASAENAHEICYNINMGTSRFGHCYREYDKMTFVGCARRDRMCGRLQCTNVTHLPHLQEHVSFHQSIISGLPCFGLDEHRSTGATDAGHVRNGTLCAPGKFCTANRCNGTVADLNYDCDPGKCNRHEEPKLSLSL
ncbi:PREDICTED: disintegrin and metalloproteinase domain-containing protein 21-like [Propithecus coquereli]|uniref:disintegrin and metalloproteinase domain-containing protein 21-like n=1 Tax=Propithecus coquereli TaxID=379532 RepID=UPI00063FA130|nr:PREDICTED: disintegrin and metalloproteinase domain-containing protein 21-like [Propithecus coquereli]